jgi:N-acetyl-alpha-D-glucosaminyl L-malate synthase BshA
LKIGVTCYPTVGGSGILATRLGIELAKKGHEIHFITYERPVAIRNVDQSNVFMHHVSVVEYPLFKYPPYTIALGSEMSRVTRNNSLDLLHVHYSIPHATAAFMSRQLTAKPYVVTLHGSDVTILGSDPSYEPINTFSIKAADAVTAVSKFMAEEAKQNLGITQRIEVIPNFVDTDIYSPEPCEIDTMKTSEASDLVITHVSNFRPVKRVDDLIYAMCIVTKEVPASRLLLIGDGPDRYKVERLIDRLDLRRNVTLTGYRNDVPNLLRCADMLVLCSETESAPLTLLEAMSTGLPVIATKVGGVPEIVRDGENGYLVPIKHPEDIAARILDISSDKVKAAKMGENARKTILENYSADSVVNKYIKVYEEL